MQHYPHNQYWCLLINYCIFRPGRTGANATGRGVLSMQSLSHGVVRVDNENSLTSLTLQDCGQVLPGGKCSLHCIAVSHLVLHSVSLVCPCYNLSYIHFSWYVISGVAVVLKLEGTPTLCKTDEVGELCVSAPYCGTSYWGLQGISKVVFGVSSVMSCYQMFLCSELIRNCWAVLKLCFLLLKEIWFGCAIVKDD